MQSKVASLWHMQEAMKNNALADPANGAPAAREARQNLDRGESEQSLADSLEEQMPELFAAVESPGQNRAQSAKLNQQPMRGEFEDSLLSDLEAPLKTIPAEQEGEEEGKVEAGEPTALVKTDRPAAWSSAASAREFLEQLASTKHPGGLARFWNARRGDIYLAIAVILVAGVIRWGIWSNHSVSATGNPAAATSHHKPAPDADLSLFDRFLVKLGLAEVPVPPENKGNPETQVWVDLHTALYYCPGTDLYGKTPKGKFTSQRDAQLDQFEPAYRKACD
jgi:hypothetical protein